MQWYELGRDLLDLWWLEAVAQVSDDTACLMDNERDRYHPNIDARVVRKITP